MVRLLASMSMRRTVALVSGATRVELSGRGRALVWTHGLLSSIDQEDRLGSSQWFVDVPGVRLVRYDARGHGRSAAGRDESALTWPALAGDLIELSTKLGLERPIAAGTSLGTATALHAALREPQRFSGLVLVSPPTAWETRKAQADLYRGGAELVKRRGVGAYAKAMREQFAAQPAPWFSADMQAEMLASIESRAPAELVNLLRGAAASDLPDPERLSTLQVPAYIVATRDDPAHPLSTAEKLHALLPRSELVVVIDVRELRSARPGLERFAARVS